jgi:hypothetical protein
MGGKTMKFVGFVKLALVALKKRSGPAGTGKLNDDKID